MVLAVLGDDPEAGEGAPLAGDVESRVPAVVRQPRVTAGLQELLDQLRLLCDHCKVEGSLRREPQKSCFNQERDFKGPLCV